MQRAPLSWVIDPDDPRAPPQEIWDQLSPEERERIVDSLPSELHIDDAIRRIAEEKQRADEAERRVEEEKQRVEEEKQGREDERRRADAIEARLAEALAEIERLKRRQ